MSSPMKSNNKIKSTTKKSSHLHRSTNSSNPVQDSKRKRQRGSTPEAGQPPVPDPPIELIQLLQSNKKVLKYFTILQKYLHQDVQKWKDRAHEYKARMEELEERMNSGNKQKKKKEATNNHRNEKVPVETLQVGVPITDEMILLDLSDDDSSNISGNSMEDNIETSRNCATTESFTEIATPPQQGRIIDSKERGDLQMTYLRKANDYLTQLGISLVVQKPDAYPTCNIHPKVEDTQNDEIASHASSTSSGSSSDSFSLGAELRKVAAMEQNVCMTENAEEHLNTEKDQNHLYSNNPSSSSETIQPHDGENTKDGRDAISSHDESTKQPKHSNFTLPIRRSDLDVARDLMYVVRMLSRSLSSDWMPFRESSHLPCYMSRDEEDENTQQQQHPTIKGIYYICDALCIMDTWATEIILTPRHEAVISNDMDESIRVGMNQRRNLVRLVVETIEIELSSGIWSTMDRHARSLPNYSLLFYDEPEDETGCFKGLDWTTNATRLSTIVERCLYAQMMASFYHNRNDIQGLGQIIVNYVWSSAPLVLIEDFPTYPPVLSLCVFEALLVNNGRGQEKQGRDNTWFSRFLQEVPTNPDSEQGDARKPACLTHALSFCIHMTALIWKLRMQSSNSRVRDISVVELAAYDRLLMSAESFWLGKKSILPNNELVDATSQGKQLLTSILSDYYGFSSSTNINDLPLPVLYTSAYPALRLMLTILANQKDLIEISHRALEVIHAELTAFEWSPNQHDTQSPCQLVILACVTSFMNAICVRFVSLPQDLRAELFNPNAGIKLDGQTVTSLLRRLLEILLEYVGNCQRKNNKQFTVPAWTLAATTVLCTVAARDGVQLLNVAQQVVMMTVQDSKIKTSELREFDAAKRLLQLRPQQYANAVNDLDLIHTLFDAAEFPVVRVINLQRRPDRWSKMVAQASRHQILLARAVAAPAWLHHSRSGSIEQQCSCIDSKTFPIWGEFAFDGIGSASEFERQMDVCLGGGPGHVETLVKSQWRPALLQPLDKHAIKENVLLRLDSTERACALSHLFSWKGVALSLVPCAVNGHRNSQEWLLHQLQISDYAKGPALMKVHHGASSNRTPVCVILEDDAILVDRFSERLQALLNELPSDFHFCSIGYSQPKKAPIFKFSEHIGIPTFLWYLTGYILSQEGAAYLLNSLPIIGPADSWIGMNMLSNFSTTSIETSEQVSSILTRLNYRSREQADANSSDQKRITEQVAGKLKFRCFAALTPLCSQQVGGEMSSTARTFTETTARASWRDRDTDITYSGYLHSCGRNL